MNIYEVSVSKFRVTDRLQGDHYGKKVNRILIYAGKSSFYYAVAPHEKRLDTSISYFENIDQEMMYLRSPSRDFNHFLRLSFSVGLFLL
jgi:hypothetical protein